MHRDDRECKPWCWISLSCESFFEFVHDLKNFYLLAQFLFIFTQFPSHFATAELEERYLPGIRTVFGSSMVFCCCELFLPLVEKSCHLRRHPRPFAHAWICWWKFVSSASLFRKTRSWQLSSLVDHCPEWNASGPTAPQGISLCARQSKVVNWKKYQRVLIISLKCTPSCQELNQAPNINSWVIRSYKNQVTSKVLSQCQSTNESYDTFGSQVRTNGLVI